MPRPLSTAYVVAHGGAGSGGELAMTIMFVTVLTVIWVALAVVCWIFWRAKKREEAAMRGRTAASMRGSTPSFTPHESDPSG